MNPTPTNGAYVTWREFNLAWDPLKDDVAEIRRDVKALLASQAGDDAISGWQRWFFGTVIFGMIGAISTLVWLAVP